jgi:hypothetical protein
VLKYLEPRPATETDGFYRSDGASSSIMRLAHFPDDFFPVLQVEGLVVAGATAQYGCDVLVELGCYDGRALEVAKFLDVGYVGVDVCREAILLLRQRIAQEALQRRASALVGDVTDPPSWLPSVAAGRPLFLLPFNIIGNFADPAGLLTDLCATGGVVVVSVFGDSGRATTLRRCYYTNCGIGPLREAPGEHGGVLFTGPDDFRSQSFSPGGFRALVEAAGTRVNQFVANLLGWTAVLVPASCA